MSPEALNAMLSAHQKRIDAQMYPEFNEDRRLVMEHMHYNGDRYGYLSNDQWTTLYLMADGFGEINADFACQTMWDWSHVRDSYPSAIRAMAERLRALDAAGRLVG